MRRVLERPPYLVVWKAWNRARRWVGRYRRWEKLGEVPHEWTRHELARDLDSRFFASSGDLDAIVSTLQVQNPDWEQRIQSAGRAVMERELLILGAGRRRIDRDIRWMRDYRSGLEFPARAYCFGIDLFDFGRGSDVRVVWEMSRLHFLIDLGKAYRLSGDARYFKEFRSLISSWMEANPIGLGVNWSCAMDVAIRAVNLLWAVSLFLSCPDFDDALVNRLMKLVFAHGRFIRRNLEYNDLRNNHYLSDLLGLLLIGQFFPEVREARLWREFAVRGLEKESSLQIHPDGVDYEGSIPYQQLVTEIYLVAEVALRRRGETFAPATRETIQSMLEFVAAYTKPGGRAPVVGDNDDGRFVPLGDQPRDDHRHLLSTGAVLFRRSDLASAAGDLWEETVWLLGPGARPQFDSLDRSWRAESRAFPQGGFFVMRAGDTHLVVDAGDVGMHGRGAHGHHDVLHFELMMDGEDLFIDTGCSSYTADRDERRRIISASAHNVAVLEGRDVAVADTWGFVQAGPTPCRVLKWESGLDRDILVAEHSGYGEQGIGVARSFELDKRNEALKITDVISGSGEGQVVISFHLHPRLAAAVAGNRVVITGVTGDFYLDADGVGTWQLEQSEVYLLYAISSSTTKASWRPAPGLPSSSTFSVRRAGA